jgi:hypothetical protein
MLQVRGRLEGLQTKPLSPSIRPRKRYYLFMFENNCSGLVLAPFTRF